ncbi:hypothetical protein DFP73DRAFT_535068 [Morchella snyderi]|nr:hypothetical protein DFP73DRAFT_535068 [Morchella snyderi]
MGFWSSNKNNKDPEEVTELPSPPAPPHPQPAAKKPTRDEQADAELAEFIAAFDKEQSSGSSNDFRKRDGRDRGEVEEEDASLGSSFPGEMNCITAFDEMYYCYSVGGQFLNVYRYGELRDCSQKSQDWRFCMRAKMYGPVTRKAMIMARNKERAAKYKTGASSEDVWKVRKTPLENAFQDVPPTIEELEKMTTT